MTTPIAPAASSPTSNAAPDAIAASSNVCTALVVVILFLLTVFGFFYVIATLTRQVGLAFLVTTITVANAIREMVRRVG
jgi:hypothetical protein